MNIPGLPALPSRRLSALLACALSLSALLPSAAAAPTVVKPTTWYSSGSAGTPVEGGGLQFATDGDTTQSGGGIQHILAYFPPVTLTNVGDSITVSLAFSGVRIGTPTSINVGFGLYDSGGKRISSNGRGQQHPAFHSYRGHRVGMRLVSAAREKPFDLRARTGDSAVLANTDTAHPLVLGTGGKVLGAARGVESHIRYDVTYAITRTGADTLDVAFSVVGGSLAGYSETWTVSDFGGHPLLTYDTFAISLRSAKILSSLILHGVTITTAP